MEKPRILLVAPDPSKLGNRPHHIKLAKTLFPPLGLLAVAGATPPDYDVSLLDESTARLDYDTPCDLVGLTANTASAPRAYEIAAEFKKRGKTVVMGGIHATALPDEALQHAHCVGVGEAEGFWPGLLADWAAGRLQPIYRNEGYPPLEGLPFPRRDLLHRGAYFLTNTIQTSRGCPFRCSFCSVHKFFGGRYRMRPLDEVTEELRTLRPDGPLIFVDDNIFGHRERAAELMERLIPMKFNWFGQASTDTLRDEKFIALAGRAGCRIIFVGFESLSNENLAAVNKPFNKPEQAHEIVQRLHRHGIGCLGAFIVGLDEDDEGVFDRIVQFVTDVQLDVVQIAIRIPIPGTDDAALLADRIFDHDYSKRDGSHVVFYPQRISPPVLVEQKLRLAYQQIYGRRGIRARLAGQRGPHVRFARRINQAYALRVNKWLQRIGVTRG
jgi:radical SAM superfamily enzyme YgiQ (UPF0313 family)